MDKEKVQAVGLTALGVIALGTAIAVGAFAVKDFVAGETMMAACNTGIALATAVLGGIGLVDGIEEIKEEF